MTRIPVALLLALPLFVGSCATIMNRDSQTIRIAADAAIRNISIEQEGSRILPAKQRGGYDYFRVPRGPQTIAVHAWVDSVEKTLVFSRLHSIAWYANIPENFGLGLLVDRRTPRRYCYTSWIYLTLKDTTLYRSHFVPLSARSFRLSVAMPLIPTFHLRSPEGDLNTSGALGLELGLDYFYRRDHYLSLSFGAATSRFGDYFGGPVRLGNTLYTALMNNRVIGAFDIGYGIALSSLRWERLTNGDTAIFKKDLTIDNTALGASLSVQYRLGHHFRVGLLYQPSLFSLNERPSFYYQHFICATLGWRFPM